MYLIHAIRSCKYFNLAQVPHDEVDYRVCPIIEPNLRNNRRLRGYGAGEVSKLGISRDAICNGQHVVGVRFSFHSSFSLVFGVVVVVVVYARNENVVDAA